MSSGIRKIICCVLSCILMLSILPLQAFAVSTSATSAVLMDVESGRVLYAQNENARMRIASTTKIMTALVAIENGSLSQTITVKRPETLVEGTSMYLKEGETLTLETLLYGLLLCSGNDAALAVADAIGGSQKQFVAMMNEEAKRLGMENTSFANPNGLDDEQHYSTALDMAKLACAAVQNETLVRIASTRQITIGGRTMTNHNKLLSYLEGCIGLKTGYTKAAGRTLVSCAVRNGQRLAAVTLQDGNDWADHEALYEYGFSAYPLQTPVEIGQTVQTLPVKGESSEEVALIAAESFSWPVAASERLTVSYDLPESLSAPVSAGTVAGQAVISLNGQEVGRVDLLCGQNILPELPKSIRLFHQMRSVLLG